MQEVAILGAGGLTGRELLAWLAHHPQLRAGVITSDKHAGRRVDECFPELQGACDLVFQTHDAALPPGAPCLLAVPNESALRLVPELAARGHRVVDLSGAFRLHDRALFEKFYKLEHNAFQMMDQIVFGLPELFRDRVRGAKLVANPGCFPTGAIAPLYFLGDLRARIASIVIDAKSGVSGAGGRVEDAGFSFNSVHENFRAYKILSHQHQPEIEEYAAHGLTGALAPLVFTPHLLPLYRGILSTLVLFWDGPAPAAEAEERLRAAGEREPFVRFRAAPEEVELAKVQHTNFLDIGVRSAGRATVIVTAIDNLVKGAAGQALQNLNLMLGLPETLGLLADRT